MFFLWFSWCSFQTVIRQSLEPHMILLEFSLTITLVIDFLWNFIVWITDWPFMSFKDPSWKPPTAIIDWFKSQDIGIFFVYWLFSITPNLLIFNLRIWLLNSLSMVFGIIPFDRYLIILLMERMANLLITRFHRFPCCPKRLRLIFGVW